MGTSSGETYTHVYAARLHRESSLTELVEPFGSAFARRSIYGGQFGLLTIPEESRCIDPSTKR